MAEGVRGVPLAAAAAAGRGGGARVEALPAWRAIVRAREVPRVRRKVRGEHRPRREAKDMCRRAGGAPISPEAG